MEEELIIFFPLRSETSFLAVNPFEPGPLLNIFTSENKHNGVSQTRPIPSHNYRCIRISKHILETFLIVSKVVMKVCEVTKEVHLDVVKASCV